MTAFVLITSAVLTVTGIATSIWSILDTRKRHSNTKPASKLRG